MKKTMALSLLAAALAFADFPGTDAARRLFDTGMRQTEEGSFEAARQTLQSLVNAYPRDPLALQAKGAIDATLLFEEGQARTKAGKYETARLAFETLIAVYPENPLVKRAQAAIEAITEKEKARRPVVKALEFRDMGTVPAEDIRAGLEEREVRLSAGRPYRARDVEQARAAVEEILAAKGVEHVRIEVQTRAAAPRAVDVIFTAAKPRASLLRTPWRLAMLGWHRRNVAVAP
jgi:outer membrane protein assembly factor BamD (BamD/ComL family)